MGSILEPIYFFISAFGKENKLKTKYLLNT
ncbi:30S ribosomal protein S15 [unidentified eubacterium SCB49]|nr:30S ribosomal protein S15 [unidentified eubacterium SCB49]